MKKTLQRMLALTLCALLLLPALGLQPAQAAGGEGIRTYRALLIGNTVYDDGQSLHAPKYDVEHMEQLLLQQDFSGDKFAPDNIIKLNDATKLVILETIKRELAAKADSDDVTYIYYSGHGTFDGTTSYIVGAEMGLISIDELKTALDAVVGQKVVIIDSCYAGGFTGRSAGTTTLEASKWKGMDAVAGVQTQAKAADASQAEFQSAILKPFMKKQAQLSPALAQRAMTTSGYKVISASSAFQYSYEYAFNSTGRESFGPEFLMNGVDYAGKKDSSDKTNYSGEFTGMLIAGAGCVSFNPVFPEIKALADVNRDRSITLDELYRYLSGAVLNSTVQVYPPDDQAVVFQHSAVDEPDWDQPALSVEDNGTALVPQPDSPVRFDLLCSQDWPAAITIEKSTKIGDNLYADNADVDIESVATVTTATHAADGSPVTLFWDGTKTDRTQAGDGWYFAEFGTGVYKYPPVPFELSRGIGNFPADTAALPQNKTFTVSLADPTARRWYSITPASDGLLELQSTNGSESKNPEVELFDEAGDSLAWSDDSYPDSGAVDYDFELLRYLKAGQSYFIGMDLSQGSSAAISVMSLFITPSANNSPVSVNTAQIAYTLFRPDVSGQWTIKAKSAMDNSASGITLYDTYFSPVAYGDRYADSYRYLSAYLEAGSTYILETPKAATSMQVAAYAPGKQPTLNTSTMPALSTSVGSAVKIAHAYDTQYYRFTPSVTNAYRFYATSPMEGLRNVDSYAFLLDANGYVLASDDDVNLEGGLTQFDFSARLSAGVTYVLAVRAYVLPGQLSSKNPTLDFTVYAKPDGTAVQTQAVSAVESSDDAVVALYDNDDNLADGIGTGGRLAGWGSSIDNENDGMTGIDFGEGQYMLHRYSPELLYTSYSNLFTRVWNVGHVFVARDAGRGYYAWGISNGDADYGTIRRLDNVNNGLGRYDISFMAQGEGQNSLYFLDSLTGKIYSMEGLAAVPQPVTAPVTGFIKIAASERSLFALDGNGMIYAMGTNRDGECGNGGTSAVKTLTAIALPESIMDFAVGDNHVVVLGSLGNVYTWGCNDTGSLGLGTLARAVSVPTQISFGSLLSGGESIVKVFAGGGSSAAITSTGRVLAWGGNDFGQLGIGSTFSQDEPVAVPALAPSALGMGKAVASITFGPGSAYAIINDGSVYVSGKNDYGQLGFISDSIKTFTQLTKPNLSSANNKLLSLKLTAGTLSPAFTPSTLEYSVIMPAGVALSTITAAKADSTATMKIDGQQGSTKTINAGPGAVRTEIEVTAQDGSQQSYVLDFPKSPSSNALLSAITLSGGFLATPINGTTTDYSIVIPETVTQPDITVAPVLADPNSSFTIDGEAGQPSKTVTMAPGQTAQLQVQVTAQLGNTRTYTFNIARNQILDSVSSTPVYAGLSSLSPGGTDRLTFQYSLSVPATVKIEVKKGSKWVTVLNRAEPTAGFKAYAWDGKINGSTLAVGTYSARVTPYFAGAPGTQQTLTLKILPKPAITNTALSPSTFTVNGVATQMLTFRWTQLSDVKVEVVTLSGSVVRSLYSAVNRPPTTQSLVWNGLNNSGVRLKAGYYKIKITCGGKVLYKKFRIK